MLNPHALIEELRQLSPDDIRVRLEEIDCEAKALRLILRAKLTAGRGRGLRAILPAPGHLPPISAGGIQ